jgi:amino acid efflux transporter
VAAIGAAVLTLGTLNAYLAGASALARTLAAPPGPDRTLAAPPRPDRTLAAPPGPGRAAPGWLPLVVVVSAGVLLGLTGAGVLDPAALVSIPSTMFLVVYLGCTAAAWRLLHGGVRLAAGAAFAGVLVILGFSGLSLLPAAAVALVAALAGTPQRQPAVR